MRRGRRNGLDDVVQQSAITDLDARTIDHRADLADPLPDHPGQLWVRVRTGRSEENPLAGGVAVCHQPRGKPDLHADPVRVEEPAAGFPGHPDGLGHDPLDDHSRLEAASLGCRGSGAVPDLGLDCDRPATVDHLDELAVAALGIASIPQCARSGRCKTEPRHPQFDLFLLHAGETLGR